MPGMRSSARRFGLWTLVALGVTSAGGPACGGGHDQSSPRGVAEAIVRAMDRGEADVTLSLLAPEQRVREAFECKNDGLGRALARARDDVRASYEELRQTGVRVTLAGFDGKGSESLRLAAGESWRDCVARAPVEVHRARLTLVYKKGARADEDGERWDFVKLPPDDLWWFIPR